MSDEFAGELHAGQTLPNPFARPIAGDSHVQLNAKNTQGFAGGFDPGTNRVGFS